ncbi:unnamed protein product [Vitrella brassicaformis CCMP3155]|uniref:Protein farnesyltransferase subunit beta n=3 Tax=Vitrella brassicaformis TaxID=1169539 RepID=A0A0G4EL98_VITBC|nr:unnamed protein product [Vitrella brassicaformis CCMP3155]|eukprot:CEL97727.1 unnamed protein product [Vitrella brassicaformis CCMP3155]
MSSHRGSSSGRGAGGGAAPPVDDGISTRTSDEQKAIEDICVALFRNFINTDNQVGGTTFIRLHRDRLLPCLMEGLTRLPACMSGLDASRGWFVFWITHSLELLNYQLDDATKRNVVSFLARCQHPDGGFGGGPGQLAHLAPTYACVAALMVIGGEEAYRCVDRGRLYSFLMRVKNVQRGGFDLHEGGESDMRGVYCAIATASMLHLLTDELVDGIPQHIAACQRWDGGIASEPGSESHGGYTYCGLAALTILGQAQHLNLHRLLDWACHRQMSVEGGFQGRTNKLVDSCYSFWLGGILPVVHEALRQCGEYVPPSHYWISPMALQFYVFLCCQDPRGLLRDKPGKPPDFYHTAYALSGTSLSQHGPSGRQEVTGHPDNRLAPTDRFYNVRFDKVRMARDFFAAQPPFTTAEGHKGREGAGVTAYHEMLTLAESSSVGGGGVEDGRVEEIIDSRGTS